LIIILDLATLIFGIELRIQIKSGHYKIIFSSPE